MKIFALKSFIRRFVVSPATVTPPLVLLIAAILLSGCKTAGVYDPVKTEQVKAALAVPIQGGIRRVLARSPQHSDEIAAYFRQIAGVFCKMRDTQKFTPEYLVDEINKLATPQISDPLVLDVKDTAVALYKLFYASRGNAVLPPDQWPYHVADLICTAFNQALLDSGKPGVSARAVPLPPLPFISGQSRLARNTLAPAGVLVPVQDKGAFHIKSLLPAGAVLLSVSGDTVNWTSPITVPWNGGTFTILDYDNQEPARFYRVALR